MPDTSATAPVARATPVVDCRNMVHPSREDGFIRGLSEMVGGPLGDHAAHGADRRRLWTAPRIVLLVALVVFGLHWLQKYPCQSGMEWDGRQHVYLCYTDVLPLYYWEGLEDGAVPYLDHPVEYPVLIGYLMAVTGLPVHALVQRIPDLNPGQLFYNLNAVVLLACGLLAVAATLALRRRRPWDALLLAAAPATLLTATVNWDLLAVCPAALFLYAWARRRLVLAGVMLGLATAAKFYPLLLAGVLIVLAIRSARWRAAAVTLGTAAVTWLVVNAPPLLWARDGWSRFWTMNSERGIDWGTLYYIGAHLPSSRGPSGGIEPFVTLGHNVPMLNLTMYTLLLLGCLGIFLLTMLAPKRPRVAQLAFLVVAVFLLTSKVWSQQFVMWLIPLAVLARPRWGAFLIWQAAEVCYFLLFNAQMLNGQRFIVPEGTYVLFSAFRWLAVAMMVGLVVRDILRPDRDLVRHTYGDDPDGGDFAGSPDAGRTWLRDVVTRLARSFPRLAQQGRASGRMGRIGLPAG